MMARQGALLMLYDEGYYSIELVVVWRGVPRRGGCAEVGVVFECVYNRVKDYIILRAF